MRLEKHKFLHHLEARGSRLDCPCCGTASWDMLIEEPVNLQDQRVMEFGLGRLGGGLAVAVVAMVCGQCGFVRMHSVDKLIQTGCPR